MRSPLLKRHEASFLLDSCLRRGVQGALALIRDKYEKKRYRRALAHTEVLDLETDLLWQNWPEAAAQLRRVVGFERSAFSEQTIISP
jgi:hypothetical protein